MKVTRERSDLIEHGFLLRPTTSEEFYNSVKGQDDVVVMRAQLASAERRAVVDQFNNAGRFQRELTDARTQIASQQETIDDLERRLSDASTVPVQSPAVPAKSETASDTKQPEHVESSQPQLPQESNTSGRPGPVDNLLTFLDGKKTVIGVLAGATYSSLIYLGLAENNQMVWTAIAAWTGISARVAVKKAGDK